MKHETKPLAEDTEYFTPNPKWAPWNTPWIWVGDCFDIDNLEKGLVYLDRYDAIAAAREDK